MKNQNKKGFTLVELVIVIAVIAILAGVMIGTFSSVVTSAKQSADYQEIKSRMDEKYYVYIADNKGNTPNCFVFSSDYSSSTTEITDDMIDFDYVDLDAFLSAGTAGTNTLTTGSAKQTVYLKKGTSGIEAYKDGSTNFDSVSSAGTYYKVEYKNYVAAAGSGESATSASWTVLTVTEKVVTDANNKNTTYYATSVEVVGDNKTTVSLSIKESESGSGNYYYSAESVKEK